MSNLSGFIKRLRDIMRNDAGINGDAQRDRADRLAAVFEGVCHQRGRLGMGGRELPVHHSRALPLGKLGPARKRKRDDWRQTPGLRQQHLVPNFEESASGCGHTRSQGHCPDHLCRRQQLHERRRPAAAGHPTSLMTSSWMTMRKATPSARFYETILKELQSAGSAGEFYTPRAVTDFMAQMIRPPGGGSRWPTLPCGHRRLSDQLAEGAAQAG